MSDSKNIVLIVCFSFPPYPGIGGRRWAKFAKYFANKGIQCHVINAQNDTGTNSVWTSDIQSPNIYLHPLKFRFQHLMSSAKKNFITSIPEKLLKRIINLTKYSPYFPVSISRKILLESCKSVIKQFGIETVIVSGNAYINYYVTQLKKDCNVKVILDYRDLWNDHALIRQNEFHELTPKQRDFSELAENSALKACDKVVCVYETMIGILMARCGKNKECFYLIPNGFDKDDYPLQQSAKFKEELITLYYGGSITPGDIADYLIQFLKMYAQLAKTNRQLWEKFRIYIKGNSVSYFEEEVRAINDPNIVFDHEIISNRQYIENLNNSTFGILSIPNEYEDNFFITKAYDYLYLRKPIIYLGKKGKVSDFIKNNSIGLIFDKDEDTESFFQSLLKAQSTLKYSPQLIAELEANYDIKNLADKYINLLGLQAENS